MSKRVLMAEVSGGRKRGRPRVGWMDGLKVALGSSGMTVEALDNELERLEGMESPGACVNHWNKRGHFCLVPSCVLADNISTVEETK